MVRTSSIVSNAGSLRLRYWQNSNMVVVITTKECIHHRGPSMHWFWTRVSRGKLPKSLGSSGLCGPPWARWRGPPSPVKSDRGQNGIFRIRGVTICKSWLWSSSSAAAFFNFVRNKHNHNNHNNCCQCDADDFIQMVAQKFSWADRGFLELALVKSARYRIRDAMFSKKSIKTFLQFFNY